jgi:hypothetical protein
VKDVWIGWPRRVEGLAKCQQRDAMTAAVCG